MSRFAADVSHEIKNPLASIKSAVESARTAHNPDQQAQMLAIVAQDVGRLDRLVTDIARASRIEAEAARGDSTSSTLARCSTISPAPTRRRRTRKPTSRSSSTAPSQPVRWCSAKPARWGRCSAT
ncbi:MAG: histidine kinase dimerization/phospho-acceptor domain-containing protein [Hyphomonadaceae bacterium]